MISLITVLREVPDPRTGNATRHDLLDVLLIALTASICGCESCVEFADFAEDREELFREFLGLENGLPSHDTFSRLFRMLDPEALAGCFACFLDLLGADGPGVVAIDGKTLHVVTAFASEARLVLGQKAVPDGGSEIETARALLRLLDLRGALVTADALHCQGETAAIVLDRGGDYLFALKANRPAMLADVAAFFDEPPAAAGVLTHTTTDADHGRIETRWHAVSHAVDWLFADRRYPGEPAMPGLACIAMVEATVEREGRTTTSRRYYLSSAQLPAEAFARAVRAHWSIENGVHWVLDVTFDEDRARNRKDHGAENLAILRKLALNVPRRAHPTSPSAANANAADGPTPSPDPYSAKCDDPGLKRRLD